MKSSTDDLARLSQLIMSLQSDLARVNQTMADIQDVLMRCGLNEDAEMTPANDPFAFITADAEREALRLTAAHPSRTAAEVADGVRHRLPGYMTTDKCVRYYWKMARKDPGKRALLPAERR